MALLLVREKHWKLMLVSKEIVKLIIVHYILINIHLLRRMGNCGCIYMEQSLQFNVKFKNSKVAGQ